MAALLLARGANVDAVRKDLEQERTGEESPTDDPRDPSFVPSVRCIPIEETALQMAVMKRDIGMIILLVCSGADTQLRRIRGEKFSSLDELCDGDPKIRQTLRAQWSSEDKHLFPEGMVKGVQSAWTLVRVQESVVPNLFLFDLCISDDVPEEDDDDDDLIDYP